MSKIDDAVQKMLDTYTAAVAAKNVTTFMHLYDPTVRVFDTWGVWSYEGAEAWQRAVEGWFTSLGSETVKVTFEDVQAVVQADMAIVTAIVRYSGFSAEGVALRSLQNRFSWGLRRSGHVLRVVHEHSSAPLGFEDMKGVLQR
jgi:ketosteroid isomerase-like protein